MFIFSLFTASSENGSESSSASEAPETTLISEGASIQGVFNLSAVNLRISGHVKGDIATDGRVVVAEEAKVEGTIKAQSVRLEGYVEAEIHAEDKIVLCPSSEVHATLDAEVLEIQPGADFIGSVGGDEESAVNLSESSSDLGSADLVRIPSSSQGGDGAVAEESR